MGRGRGEEGKGMRLTREGKDGGGERETEVEGRDMRRGGVG